MIISGLVITSSVSGSEHFHHEEGMIMMIFHHEDRRRRMEDITARTHGSIALISGRNLSQWVTRDS